MEGPGNECTLPEVRIKELRQQADRHIEETKCLDANDVEPKVLEGVIKNIYFWPCPFSLFGGMFIPAFSQYTCIIRAKLHPFAFSTFGYVRSRSTRFLNRNYRRYPYIYVTK